MPQLRHECTVCGVEKLDLYGPFDPGPVHCGQAMRLLMPRRVVGRCRPDSNGVHSGSGFARSQPSQAAPPPVELDGEELAVVGNPDDYEAKVPESRIVSSPIDPTDPNIVPPPTPTGVFAKDYEQCSADERTERWRDGAEALAAWTSKGLEEQGKSPTEARTIASEAAQKTISNAREQASRDDGLT